MLDKNLTTFPSADPCVSPNPAPLPDMYHPEHCHHPAPPTGMKPTFTAQEEFIETSRRVNHALHRVLALEENIRRTLDNLSSNLTADNVAFKSLCMTTYNQFSTAVHAEVNAFETEILNSYQLFEENVKNDWANFETNFDTFKNEINEKISEFEGTINNTYDEFRKSIENRIDQYNENHVQAFNNYVSETNNRIAEAESKLTGNYLEFTEGINNSYEEYKRSVNTHLSNMQSMIKNIDYYFRSNFGTTVDGIIRVMSANGELAKILNEQVLPMKVDVDVYNEEMAQKLDKEMYNAHIQDFSKYESEVGGVVSGLSDALRQIDELRATNTAIQTQIGALTALPEGSTTGDAELMDIRIGDNGRSYNSAGQAVRGMLTDIRNYGIHLNTISLYSEIDDNGSYIGNIDLSTGKLITGTYTVTDFIEFNNNCYGVKTNDTNSSIGFYFYDKDKNYLGRSFHSSFIADRLYYTSATQNIANENKNKIYYVRAVITNYNGDDYYYYLYKLTKGDLSAVQLKKEFDNFTLTYALASYGFITGFTNDSYITYQNGSVASNTGYHASQFIDIRNYRGLQLQLVTSACNDNGGMAFYDKDKNYITGQQTATSSNSVQGSDNTKRFYIDIPENAYYFRFTYHGSEPVLKSGYYIYLDKINIRRLINKVDSNTETLKKEVANLTEKQLLFTHESSKYIQYLNGAEVTHTADLSATGFIKIYPFGVITLDGLGFTETNDLRGLAFYDVDKNFISGYQYTGACNSVSVAVPHHAEYVRFTVKTDNVAITAVQKVTKLSDELTYLGEELDKLSAQTECALNPLDVVKNDVGFTSCFLNVGVIGDSLASGECVSNNTGENGYTDIYEHSWGKYLERMTGSNYNIWASGGRTVNSWLASSYAEECFDGEHKCEAYIIALGVNDVNSVTRGGVSDINMTDYNKNIDSYYGSYAKIIQKLQEQNDKAKIFVVTAPNKSVENSGFNEAVRTMADIFSNVYVIDLYKDGYNLFNGGLIKKCERQGHYNAIAYKYMARIIGTYIDWIIQNNVNEFSQIEFILTDKSYT